jgi:hypothetical protein
MTGRNDTILRIDADDESVHFDSQSRDRLIGKERAVLLRGPAALLIPSLVMRDRVSTLPAAIPESSSASAFRLRGTPYGVRLPCEIGNKHSGVGRRFLVRNRCRQLVCTPRTFDNDANYLASRKCSELPGRDRLGVTLPDDAGDVIADSLNQRDADFTDRWIT